MEMVLGVGRVWKRHPQFTENRGWDPQHGLYCPSPTLIGQDFLLLKVVVLIKILHNQ